MTYTNDQSIPEELQAENHDIKNKHEQEEEEEAQRPKHHLRTKYPPAAVSASDLVAVAWNNVFSIGKIMSNLEKNIWKVVREEDYVRKDSC